MLDRFRSEIRRNRRQGERSRSGGHHFGGAQLPGAGAVPGVVPGAVSGGAGGWGTGDRDQRSRLCGAGAGIRGRRFGGEVLGVGGSGTKIPGTKVQGGEVPGKQQDQSCRFLYACPAWERSLLK